ncbi:MAG: 30S ribosomal protein S6 [Campylobacterota bacterium]|nr:30S ribosomal protein S6 [Campylobacterota bacterium]
MRHYENLVIVKPTLTEEEIKNSLANIEDIITSNGGEIATRDDMGMRKLAYPIQKNLRGHFYVIYFKIAPSAISEIERRYRINEEILRFVTVKYDSKREVKAWNELVEKANKKIAQKAPVAPATPAVEEAPEAPATPEAPAS